MKKIILLLTHSKDHYTIDHVERAIARKGCRPFRFNTDRFPQNIKLSIHLNHGDISLSLQDENQEEIIHAVDIYSVWLRKIATPYIDPKMDTLLRNGCIKESKETLAIFLNELDTVRWIDHLPVVRRAGNKLYQLRMAESIGIKTPKTLIANDPQKVRRFYRQLKGNIVAKMLTPLTQSMGGNNPFVHTNRIDWEMLKNLETLRFSPMVFQEWIPKEYELRIAYVNGQLFTGAVNCKNQDETPAQADWRTMDTETFKWEPFSVHGEFADKIRQLMKKIGLCFGALDVIVKDGQYVFLEVNPSGEWGMLERDLDLPISNAIANALTA